MQGIIGSMIHDCNECNKTKSSRHAPYGLLKPLPALDRAWKVIAIDFIIKLLLLKELLTKAIFNLIFVTTCRLSKYRKFILYKEGSNIEEFFYIFLKYIIINYKLLKEVILDRNKL